jgi:hypothetical protein
MLDDITHAGLHVVWPRDDLATTSARGPATAAGGRRWMS